MAKLLKLGGQNLQLLPNNNFDFHGITSMPNLHGCWLKAKRNYGNKMNNDLMFSSETDQWSTPQDFFNKLNSVFHFTLDVCADINNHKCLAYFDKSIGLDGLKMQWTGVCWMNPPYGREIGDWVKKAYESSRGGGVTVVCLLPARTDTKWWHNYCAKGEVHFLKRSSGF